MRVATSPLPGRSETAEPADAVVVVTGADGSLGRRVVARLREEPSLGPVLALGRGLPSSADSAAVESVDLLTGDLKSHLHGASVLVHLDAAYGPALDDDPTVSHADDVTAAQRLLDAAGAVAIDHVVVLSSATVYGAWANNSLPLTEDATLRPCPDLAFAVQRAEVERRVAEWRHDHPSATVTVLRPAPVVGDGDDVGDDGWLARALHAARKVADIEGDPPAQFLHVDDLASAIVLAVTARLGGARNVAPDGWLRGVEYTALDAGTPKLRVPRSVGDRVARLRWRLRLAPTPPGILPYARGPWVVANDRLKADGWRPEHSNAEAFVAGTPATALATLSPRRRQELALGVAGGALALGTAAGGWAVMRRLRSPR